MLPLCHAKPGQEWGGQTTEMQIHGLTNTLSRYQKARIPLYGHIGGVDSPQTDIERFAIFFLHNARYRKSLVGFSFFWLEILIFNMAILSSNFCKYGWQHIQLCCASCNLFSTHLVVAQWPRIRQKSLSPSRNVNRRLIIYIRQWNKCLGIRQMGLLIIDR